LISVVVMTPENIESFLDSIMEIERGSFISPWSRNGFLQEARNPISHLWVITDEDGSPGGYICFWMFDREIQLINVAVHPEKRGRGFGSHLLGEMIRIGIERGMEQVWLEVRTSNNTAKRIYKKLGFVAVGLRPMYYRDTNEDAIVMSLNLLDEQSASTH
jgi:ribosomal-protein-alanine N-acetyltransferase